MLFKDTYLLEKAYLSISQPMKSVPSDEEQLPMTPEEGIEPDTENEVSSEEMPEMRDDLGSEVIEPEMGLGAHNPEEEMNPYDECEEDSMAVDNLNSIRESAMKIAQCWEKGSHLEPWQQQKLAIAMEMLAEVARALR